MSRLRDRLVEGWAQVLPVSAVVAALLMFLEWRRQRRRLNEQVQLEEGGWERPDA